MIVEQTFTVPPLSPVLATVLRIHGIKRQDLTEQNVEDLETIVRYEQAKADGK